MNAVPSLTIVLEAMRQKGIAFESGLTAQELEAIEDRYGFRFPADLANSYRLSCLCPMIFLTGEPER